MVKCWIFWFQQKTYVSENVKGLQLVCEDSLFVTNWDVNWEYDNSGTDCHDILTLFKYKNMCGHAVHFLVDFVFSVCFFFAVHFMTLLLSEAI